MKIPSYPFQIFMGMDPEAFITTEKGRIIGAEKLLKDKKPISAAGVHQFYEQNKIIPDGIQIEFNPMPRTCRAQVCYQLVASFRELKKQLDANNMKASFTGVISVAKAELESLDADSRRLGCAPSLNVFDAAATVKVRDGYRTRSAGGHLHFGLMGARPDQAADYPHFQPAVLVPLLDAILGNTCVMIDTDPKQRIRRRVYGRAGEYRLPPHGLEYRTLSNFWLRSIYLSSFVMGLGRQVISALYYAPKAMTAMLGSIDMSKVRKAINTNNADLARETWDGVVKPWIVESFSDVSRTSEAQYPLGPNVMDEFEFFLSKGIDHWFPKEKSLDSWLAISNMDNCHSKGWETFLLYTVRPQMKKEKATHDRILRSA